MYKFDDIHLYHAKYRRLVEIQSSIDSCVVIVGVPSIFDFDIRYKLFQRLEAMEDDGGTLGLTNGNDDGTAVGDKLDRAINYLEAYKQSLK